MKRRFLLVGLTAVLGLTGVSALAQSQTKSTGKKKPCAGAKTIRDCPDQGCGGKFDPELNKRKNISTDDGRPAVLRSIAWMHSLKNPTKYKVKTGDRSELQNLEGQKITVVALALAARSGSQETCNCYLSKPTDTDNHIVLVDADLKSPSLARNEKRDSETVEFTPRIRLGHPKFTQQELEPLIDPDWAAGQSPRKGSLLVRVTGYLMFDTEHFLRNPLKRYNNWEIHPVLKMEYCPDGVTCEGDNDEGWVNIESE